MKITAGKADAFTRKPNADVWSVLVYGPDRGLARERVAALLTAFGIDCADPFGVTALEEAAVKAEPALLQDELRALTFGGGARAVRVSLTGDGAAAAVTAALEAIDAHAFAPAARLIVDAGDLTPRAKIRKAFEGAARAAALPCYRDDVADLERLAAETLTAAGVALTPAAHARLLPRLEGDRALARGELDKLILYAGDQSEPLTETDIDAIITGAEPADLDAIADAALSGHAAEADAAYERALEAGASPVSLCRAVQRALTRLETVKALSASGGVEEALNRARPPVFGPRRARVKAHVRLWSERALAAASARVFDTERALKQSGAPDQALCGRMLLAIAMMAERR